MYQDNEWGALRPGTIFDASLRKLQEHGNRWHGIVKELEDMNAEDDDGQVYPPSHSEPFTQTAVHPVALRRGPESQRKSPAPSSNV